MHLTFLSIVGCALFDLIKAAIIIFAQNEDPLKFPQNRVDGVPSSEVHLLEPQ